MKLGIMVTTARHLDEVVGLSKAAVAKGHEVIIFNTDEGTKLLEEPSFRELCSTKGVVMSFCDHSAHKIGVKKEGLPETVSSGSQYNNAVLVHDSDRVIRL